MARKITDEDEDQNDGAGIESEEEDENDEQNDGVSGTEGVSDEDGDDEDDEAAIIATLTPDQAKLFTSLSDRLTKANASARSRRLALRALRQGKAGEGATGTGPKPTAPKKESTGGGAATFDPEAFKAELLASIEGKQEAGRIQTAAEKELRKAGLILPDDADAADRKLARVMRMLDLNGVALDEVAEEVSDLKADNPELFGKRKRRRPAAGGVSGPARVSGVKAPDRIAGLFD